MPLEETRRLKNGERWTLAGLASLQPLLVLGMRFPFTAPVREILLDAAVRLLLAGIAAWIRFWLFPGLRNRSLRAWLMFFCPLAGLVAFAAFGNGGIQAIFGLTDGLVNGVLVGLILETIFAAGERVIGPVSGDWSSSGLADRLQRLRTAVDVQKRLVLAVTALLLLVFYVLTRRFLFDLVLYSRLAAAVVGLGFLLPLLVLDARVKHGNEEELRRVERELEGAVDRQLIRLNAGPEQHAADEISFWFLYRRILTTGARIPVTWEVWAYLLVLMAVILVEPYLFGAWAL